TLYPEAATSWEHTFTATMQGFGTGTPWCEDKEQISYAKIEQAIGRVEFIMEDGIASNADELATIYVVPHVSMFQQVYPNPVAIGEIVTVVLTLRDNRTDPITPVTGINLQWNLPANAGFTLVDTDPMTSSSNAASAFWDNVELPLGGEFEILIHMRAPWYKEPGWKRTYYSTAQVNSLNDMANICFPKSTRFIKSRSGAVGPDHELGLPGPIPDFSDQYFGALEVNQGIEIDKISDPKEIGPYGEVDYEIVVKNLTGAPVPSIVITDILPFVGVNSWQYLETIDGIEPHGEDPLYWNIGTIEALGEIRVVIKTRAISAVGLALNKVLGTGPINIGYHKDYTTHVGVMVVSGIGFYKVVDPESILAGEATTYTIRLYNGALYDIQPVIITDTLPVGFSFDGMVSPPDLLPVIEGQQLVWTLPTKVNKSGGTYDIVFRARTATEAEGMFSGKYYNDIVASAQRADTGDPVEVPPTGPTAPVHVDGLPTVEVDKTATPNTVIAGQDVVYTITLYNEAPTARVLQITDTLPTNFTLVELIDPTAATTAYVGGQQQIIWHDISIGAQLSRTLTFRAHVADEAPPGRYGNVVQIQIDAFVLPPSQPMANVWVIELPHTDAKVSKTDGTTVVQKGATINYTINYNNASAEIAFQTIVLTETISPPPPYITVGGTDWEDLGDGRFRYEVAGPLNPGASGTVQFSVQLANDIPNDYQWLHNQVEIGYTTDEPTTESTPADNVAEDWDLISGGESIVALKQASYADETLLAGQELTYTIMLFNATTQAESVRITDTLPVSFTLSAAVSPPIEMTQLVGDHQQVVWDEVDIAAQDFAYIVFRARVDPAAVGGIACNVLQVQRGDGEVLPETEPQACVEVQPLQRVDAYVSKTDNVDWALPGANLLYRIQYGNAATSEAPLATIVLTETVSPPEVIDTIVSAGWEALGNGQYRTSALSGLAAGETRTAYFEIKLKDTIPPTMTAVYNQVEIGYTTAEPAVEINRFDNIGTDVTVLQLNPDDVMVAKSVAALRKPAYPGDVVTYTINIFNDTTNAYTLRVTDTLPLHFTFEAAVDPLTGYTTQWDGNRQLVICETTVAAKTTRSLIFRAAIAPTAPTSRYCNDVQVQRGTVVQAPITGLACLDVLSSIKVVDAQVTKSDGRTSVMAGETLTYTITYMNATTSALTFQTVILTETISPIGYLTILSADWNSLGGGRYTREIVEPVTPGVSRQVQFIVQVHDELPDTVSAITNTVEIGYTTLEPADEINLANNTATDVTLVGSGILPGTKVYLPLVLRNR
ncbi:MAG: DUF11 domain-containing protein, partial [Anaerolineae bacterium]|nr:DUF11 domain-containing protein [Anaerolineae bacterium]